MAENLTDFRICAERIFAHAGPRLRLATPLGLGKPNVLINELVSARGSRSASRTDIYTALSLARPHAASELERRFLEPFLARHFGTGYPDLEWVAAQHSGTLPANVRMHEFYLQSGAMLGVPSAQRDYVSINYTHVARDLRRDRDSRRGPACRARADGAGGRRYSLASNPDVGLDLLDRIAATARRARWWSVSSIPTCRSSATMPR